jgi:hypothetical protein
MELAQSDINQNCLSRFVRLSSVKVQTGTRSTHHNSAEDVIVDNTLHTIKIRTCRISRCCLYVQSEDRYLFLCTR